MFTDFFYHLRSCGLNVGIQEWLGLLQALVRGHARCSLTVFYHLARALVVKQESDFDAYDRAFASFFEGVEAQFTLDDELLQWLQNPVLPRASSEAERQALQQWDLETLRDELEKRMREQTERHDGGSHWIGTGGTSPFGHSGTHPAGIRVGGPGGGRSAVQVAQQRRFQNLRADRVLDTRQIGSALRRLRQLTRDPRRSTLDLDASIDATARQGGEIELVYSAPRTNQVKLLLLMDVGGSMDPHAELCERLFSATHAASHFKHFAHYFFHNCIYETLYSDMRQWEGVPTESVLQQLDATWSVILVGDAWMSPYELTLPNGAIWYAHKNAQPGLWWLQTLRERCPNSVWLNPEPERIWSAPSIDMVRRVFPMFPLTLEGLGEAVDMLRGSTANRPEATQRA